MSSTGVPGFTAVPRAAVVLGDQNAMCAVGRCQRRRKRHRATAYRTGRGGQLDGDAGAESGCGLDPCTAIALRDHRVHRRQAEPRALSARLGREEGFERARGDRIRHACAGVAHLQYHMFGAIVVRLLTHDDAADAAGWQHRVAGVGDELHYRLLELTTVSIDMKIRRHVEHQLQPLSANARQQAFHAVQRVGDRSNLWLPLRPRHVTTREKFLIRKHRV